MTHFLTHFFSNIYSVKILELQILTGISVKKVGASDFALRFKTIKLSNGAKRKDPYYLLTLRGAFYLVNGHDVLLRESVINQLLKIKARVVVQAQPFSQTNIAIKQAQMWTKEQKAMRA